MFRRKFGTFLVLVIALATQSHSRHLRDILVSPPIERLPSPERMIMERMERMVRRIDEDDLDNSDVMPPYVEDRIPTIEANDLIETGMRVLAMADDHDRMPRSKMQNRRMRGRNMRMRSMLNVDPLTRRLRLRTMPIDGARVRSVMRSQDYNRMPRLNIRMRSDDVPVGLPPIARTGDLRRMRSILDDHDYKLRSIKPFEDIPDNIEELEQQQESKERRRMQTGGDDMDPMGMRMRLDDRRQLRERNGGMDRMRMRMRLNDRADDDTIEELERRRALEDSMDGKIMRLDGKIMDDVVDEMQRLQESESLRRMRIDADNGFLLRSID